MNDENTVFFLRNIIEERNAAIDRLTEEVGALQVSLDNALRERDALSEVAGSLQEMVTDLQAEVAELKKEHLLLGRGDWDAKDWWKGVTGNELI